MKSKEEKDLGVVIQLYPDPRKEYKCDIQLNVQHINEYQGISLHRQEYDEVHNQCGTTQVRLCSSGVISAYKYEEILRSQEDSKDSY